MQQKELHTEDYEELDLSDFELDNRANESYENLPDIDDKELDEFLSTDPIK
jgi:hypothetical protein